MKYFCIGFYKNIKNYLFCFNIVKFIVYVGAMEKKNLLSTAFDLKKSLDRKKAESSKKPQDHVEDFVPYACLWDKDTVLTKNSEILQVIKITGFTRESIGSERINLIDLVRKAIKDNLGPDDDKCAFWFHTVRRKQNLDIGGTYPVGFPERLNESWKKLNKWEDTFVNEVYITVIMDGNSASIIDGKTFLMSLFPSILKKNYKNYVSQNLPKLNHLVDKILEALSPFGAARLSLVKRRGQYYSEQMEFLYKLLNLERKEVKVEDKSIVASVENKGLVVDFNTIKVKSPTKERYGAMFSFKEYTELPGDFLDLFMQLPNEFIITQTLDFISCNKALEEYKEAKKYMKAGKDKDLFVESGLKKILDSNHSKPTDYGESQTTMFLFNEDLEQLDENIVYLSDKFHEIGLIAPRRDVRLEECFWAQLPANFDYISRKKPIATSLVAGYATLFNYPAGQRYFNKWGPAVCMFHTFDKTPFFFNFHVGENGHTAIVGPQGAGKTVLSNFMISEALKFNCRLAYFDTTGRSRSFIKALNGKYIDLKVDGKNKSDDDFSFNPLALANSKKNKVFLKEFFSVLASLGAEHINRNNQISLYEEVKNLRVELTDDDENEISNFVTKIMSLPLNERVISEAADYFSKLGLDNLSQIFELWSKDGDFYHMFNQEQNPIFDVNSKITGFSFNKGDIINHDIKKIPILMHLLHLLEDSLDGSPTIIVLNEAWNLVNNDYFVSKINSWLRRLTEKNTLVIFATEAISNDRDNPMTNAVVNSIATRIFLANVEASKASKAYKEVWGLEEKEFSMLSKIRPLLRQFVLKQDDKAIMGNLDLTGINEVNILSSSPDNDIIINDIISKKGEDPLDWLDSFYENVKENNNQH